MGHAQALSILKREKSWVQFGGIVEADDNNARKEGERTMLREERWSSCRPPLKCMWDWKVSGRMKRIEERIARMKVLYRCFFWSPSRPGHVGLYIYDTLFLGPLIPFRPTSLVVLSILTRLNPGDRCPWGIYGGWHTLLIRSIMWTSKVYKDERKASKQCLDRRAAADLLRGHYWHVVGDREVSGGEIEGG